MIRNNIAKRNIDDLLKIHDEIKNYCEDLNNGVYSTKYRLIIVKAGFKHYREIAFNDIISCKESIIKETSGESFIDVPAILITTNDNKSIKLYSSERLKEVLDNYIHSNKKVDKNEKSSIIDNYEEFGDYNQGFIDLPLFNKLKCSLWIESNVPLSYSEKVASAVKKLRLNDISDAMESTVWYYNNLINEYGYNDSLKNMPPQLEKKDVLDYLDLEEIYINRVEDDSIRYTIWFKTLMEPEHGISWGFKDNKVVFVGSGSEWTEDDISKEYNFAKGYHQEVLLKNDD